MGIAHFKRRGHRFVDQRLICALLADRRRPGAPVPPFQVHVGWVEAGWLSLAFGVILLLTLIGTIFYLVRLKVFQAVKMGESL